MRLFEATLSFEGRPSTRVFGAREHSRDGCSGYDHVLWVDAASLDPDILAEIVAASHRAIQGEWKETKPWSVFRFDFGPAAGQPLDAGLLGGGPDRDGALHFSHHGQFVGPPCPMTEERYYRLNHPSVKIHGLRPRETVPYPKTSPPPKSLTRIKFDQHVDQWSAFVSFPSGLSVGFGVSDKSTLRESVLQRVEKERRNPTTLPERKGAPRERTNGGGT